MPQGRGSRVLVGDATPRVRPPPPFLGEGRGGGGTSPSAACKPTSHGTRRVSCPLQQAALGAGTLTATTQRGLMPEHACPINDRQHLEPQSSGRDSSVATRHDRNAFSGDCFAAAALGT